MWCRFSSLFGGLIAESLIICLGSLTVLFGSEALSLTLQIFICQDQCGPDASQRSGAVALGAAPEESIGVHSSTIMATTGAIAYMKNPPGSTMRRLSKEEVKQLT